MKAFSFVHVADLHLGYAQYGLEVRRQDFDAAFQEVVEKTINLKADFMIIAGDLFHQARPSNVTLENAIRNFKKLKEAGIPVLTVDGSHDSAPNSITGTILNPLDSAGLIYHLPRHDGAFWKKPGSCYVYGIPNFRTRRKTEEALPEFMKQNPPQPDPEVTNIFVLHSAIDLPEITPPYIEAETPAELIPDGFDYYAGGHIHQSYLGKLKSGILAYSGSTETVSYNEGTYKKNFYHVKVNEKGEFSSETVELSSSRKFIILDDDYSGLTAQKISDLAVQRVKDADEEGAIIIPLLKGILPTEANRSEIDVAHIRGASEKALLVHPIVTIRESAVPDEVVRSIFESEFKDLKTKALEYFIEIFSDRYGPEEAEKIAYSAVSLIDPLTRKQNEKVKQMLEELLN